MVSYLQADCPEDAATYIHRVGRTARYMAAGRALMLLTPGEHAGMVEALAEAKVGADVIAPDCCKLIPCTACMLTVCILHMYAVWLS